MFVGLRHVLLLSVCLIFASGQAHAVALGKIEVTSHLGEAFFAEAPLQLEDGEKVADVTVETAAPSDYQILEVFRDPALGKLTVEVVNDLRGPRAVISSAEAIDTPYFNLVLKLRYGHATNFKKYPVFLDLPEQVRPSNTPPAPVAVSAPVATQPVQPVPEVSRIDVSPEQTAPVSEVDDAAVEPTGSEFNPYEGWARTSRYGPMVRGDSVSTVARRLRVDERYTLNQVMVGLFNKNRDKFREDNINLINAGTYLNVPTAEEVESVAASRAEAIIKQQEQRWKELRNQPVYAAEAEAQKNRYRTRVHVGQRASGEAAAPVQQQTPVETAMVDSMQQAGADTAVNEQMRTLQDENLRLKQALDASEARAASAPPASADAAAAEEQVKKLELTVARLQRQLKLVNEQLAQVQSQKMNTLTVAMAVLVVLLIGVAGYLLYLLRRDRPHPTMPAAQPEQAEAAPDASQTTDAADGVTEAVAPADEAPGEMGNADLAASLDEVPGGVASEDDSLLFEDKKPIAEAGVDYLAEAEVYLRYGMDEEALQQMHLAIEQKPSNLEAHRKLVQLLQSRGEPGETQAAIEAARSALADSDLEAFESEFGDGGAEQAQPAPDDSSVSDALAEGGEHDQQAGEIDIDDLLVGMGESGEAPAVESADEDGDDALGMDMAESLGQPDEEPVVELPETAADDDVNLADKGKEKNEPAAEADETTVGDDGLDFVSTIDISAGDDIGSDAVTDDVTDSLTVQSDSDAESQVEGVDQPSVSAGEEAAANQVEVPGEGLDFNTGEPASAAGTVDEATEIGIADDDLNLDQILGEYGADAKEGDAASIDFASAGEEVGYRDNGDDNVPETVINSGADDGELEIDDILGEIAADDEPAANAAQAESGSGTDEATVIEADGSDDDLGLDEILGEFENNGDESKDRDTAGAADASAPETDLAAMPDMDVSEELDGLLAEWGEEGESLDFEAGPESLDVDRARSLIAEGSLDEAETALQSALQGERRGDALIGLAEVAGKRGDAARASELLAEAESLVNDGNREWFDSVKSLSA